MNTYESYELRAIGQEWLFAGGLNDREEVVRSLDTVSPADLARECLDGWWCGDNVDCAPDDGDLAEAFAELAANRAWLEE